MASTLTVHVLGPRVGESVILALPDGSVGVIDSFASSGGGPHPVIGFLERTYLGLRRLRFLALTHPHADHVFRADEIAARYPPDEVWLFDPSPATIAYDYFRALARHETRDRVEAALALRAGSVAESLLRLHRLMDSRIRSGTVRFRQLLADQPVARFCRGKVRVQFLTPGPRHCHDYRSRLGSALATIAGTADDPADLPHNLTSGAVLVEFGKTRLLLMADAERPSWREWFSPPRDPSSFHPLHFVKSSHHGSENGCHPPLYTSLCDPTLTLAVLTPFGNGTTPLPTRAGIAVLRPLVNEVYCTNRFLAQATSGLLWDGVPPAPIPAVPERWRRMIVNRPALSDLLIPERGGTPGAILPALPRSWMQDALRDPDFWRLLRGDACPPASSAPATEHVISASYDSKGGLRRLMVGAGAGRLGRSQ